MKRASNSISVTCLARKGAQLLAEHHRAQTGQLPRGYTALRH
jgi:hypothetical protein